MKVEIIAAWPRRHQSVEVELAEGATVADALQVAAFDLAEVSGYAIFGVRADLDTRLRDGDRVELLRPLLMDPKEARRLRARKPKA